MSTREIIQLITDAQGNLYALCNDSTVWVRYAGDWKQIDTRTVTR